MYVPMLPLYSCFQEDLSNRKIRIQRKNSFMILQQLITTVLFYKEEHKETKMNGISKVLNL